MKRVTKRLTPEDIARLELSAHDLFGRGKILYIGKYSSWRKDPVGALPGNMSQDAVRFALCRLAEYEDTGLTPQEILENLGRLPKEAAT